MKILMISDLHIDDTLKIDFTEKIVNQMAEVINSSISENDELGVFVLGDIIDKGDDYPEKKYKIAEQVFIQIKNSISTQNIKFYFIPGNHDVSSRELVHFDRFSNIFSFIKIEFNSVSIFEEKIEGFNVVFADSVTHRERDNGLLNIDEIKNIVPDILCLHHAVKAQYDWNSFVYNAQDILNLNCQFILHGHTHGASCDTHQNTKIIHVGSLLLDYSKYGFNNINNQFNLLDMENHTMLSIINYRYFGDLQRFEPTVLYSKDNSKIHETNETEVKLLSNNSLYIERKVIRCSEHDENGVSLFLNNQYKDLRTALKDDKLILLIGEAGSGKSYELKNLYDLYLDSAVYYPLYFSIRDYTFEEIKSSIYTYGKLTNNKTTIYIFDGLDEIEPQFKNELIKFIRKNFTKENGMVSIISSRENFAVDIPSFEKYRLLKMTNSNINEYLLKSKISIEIFNKAVNDLNCNSEMEVPFYLSSLIQFIKEDKDKIDSQNIMEILISSRISDDINKYDTTIDLRSNKYNLIIQLEKIAFAMQLMKQYSLSDENYQSLFDDQTRNMIKYFGAFSYREDKDSWEFEHNNFREYLAAKHLNSFSFSDIINIISCGEANSKLRPSWLNVVGYLLRMQKDEDLLNWLIEHAKDSIYSFESDKLREEDKDNIFISLFTNATDKQLPIFTLFDTSKLGRYFQSPKTIEFLLCTLKSSSEPQVASNILHVLRNFTNFYARGKEIKDILFDNLLNISIPEHVVALAIEVLSKVYINKENEIIEEILEIMKNDFRHQVFAEVSELLVSANQVDMYIDYIINATENVDNYTNFSASNAMNKALINVTTVKGISAVINLFCNKTNTYNLDRKSDIFKNICEKASNVYLNGDHSIFEIMVDAFITLAGNCHKEKCSYIKKFFSDTNTLEDAFKLILTSNPEKYCKMFSIEELMDESLSEILIEKYLNTEDINNEYKWYALRLSQDSTLFKKLDAAVLKKEGVNLEIRKVINWESNHKECIQRYFNSLFEPESFQMLIDELLNHIKVDNILCDQLVRFSDDEIYDFSQVPHEREDLQCVRTSIYHSNLDNIKVADFLKNIDWELFSIYGITSTLESNKQQINLSDVQKNHIYTYLNNYFSNLDFEKAGRNELTVLISLATMTEFKFSDESLLDMIPLPWYIFKSSTSTGESIALDFVSERISNFSLLKNRILKNMKKTNLNPLTAQTYLLYCLKEKIDVGVDIAIELFNSTHDDAKYHKNTAVDYLIEFKGLKFVDDLIQDTADDNLLIYLVHCLKSDNENLVNILTTKNQKSNNQTLYLKQLINLNNRYALEKYLSIATELNCLPDKTSKSSQVGEITLSIREVSEINLLDIILKLLVLSHSEHFCDNESFGLKSAIDTVLNTFSQINKNLVSDVLKNLAENNLHNNNLVRACNWHLNNIEKMFDISDDEPCDIKTVANIIQ